MGKTETDDKELPQTQAWRTWQWMCDDCSELHDLDGTPYGGQEVTCYLCKKSYRLEVQN